MGEAVRDEVREQNAECERISVPGDRAKEWARRAQRENTMCLMNAPEGCMNGGPTKGTPLQTWFKLVVLVTNTGSAN